MSIRTYTKTRPKGLAPWKPRGKNVAIVKHVRLALADFADYLPVTARQLFYRLVGAYDYPKSETAYDALTEVIKRARRAGMIAWSAIRDDGFTVSTPRGFDGVSDFWASVADDAEAYSRNRQTDQAVHVELWVEAAGMVPLAARRAFLWGVPVYSAGGFNSVTALHATALRMLHRAKPTTVLHIGDFDASGCSIFDRAEADVLQFVTDYVDRGFPFDHLIEFHRLAVTPTQIETLALPGAPPKKGDDRGGWDLETVQAEAIPPATLLEIIDAGIEIHLDRSVLKETIEEEQDERAQLMSDLRAFIDGGGAS